MTFIGFKESVLLSKQSDNVEDYGVPERILNNIKCPYDGSTSAVCVDGILSKEFLVINGGLQRDTLGPRSLFIHYDPQFCTTEHRNNNRITDLLR